MKNWTSSMPIVVTILSDLKKQSRKWLAVALF